MIIMRKRELFLVLLFPLGRVHAQLRSRRTSSGIVGHVDTVYFANPNDKRTDYAFVTGWTCQPGIQKSLAVRLYAGGTHETGVLLKTQAANLPSEPAVKNICQGDREYRFALPITLADATSHGGKAIFVEATGGEPQNQSSQLVGSGNLAIPEIPVLGYVDIAQIDKYSNIVVAGWTCQQKVAASISATLSIEGKSGGASFVETVVANRASEDAISRRCETSSNAHRYVFVLPPAKMVKYEGQPIRIHGVSLDTKTKKLLASSKVFTIPKVVLPFSGLIATGRSQATTHASQVEDITIPAGTTYVLDQSIEVGLILVAGTLKCSSTARTIELRTNGIVVAGSTGLFECGSSASDPSPVDLSITLTGNRDAQLVYGSTPLGPKAIVAIDGGVIKLHGRKGREGFQYLQKTAFVGSNTIELQDTSGWHVGDRIVVSPTDFDPAQAEEFTISRFQNSRVVVLDRPMKYVHWGSIEHYNNGKGRYDSSGSNEQYNNGEGKSWILDERAEVFNLKRTIRIASDEDSFASNNLIGGHMIIRGEESAGYIDNVEFMRVGQAGEMGRYPFHWHRAGDVHGQYLRHSSIHDSYQRCVVLHRTNFATIEGNTCYNHYGHGFFLEDGNEVKNVIVGNLGVLSKRPSTANALLQSDITGDIFRFAPTATFWISHPDNVVERNVAAGSEGSGFWMAFVPTTTEGVSPPATPLTAPTLLFNNNRAHSSMVCITHDGAPSGGLVANPNNPKDHAAVPVHYDPPTAPVFENLVAFKCSESGIYFRGNRAIYRNAILADNKRSFFVSNDQELIDSLVVGTSKNIARSHHPTYSGVMVYDGPLWIDSVHFAHFSKHGSMAIDKIQAARLGTNQFQRLTFQNANNKINSISKETTWSDEMCSSVHDVDGSLTGARNHLVVPNHPWNIDSRCRVSIPGEYSTLVCDYDVSYLWILNVVTGEGNDLGFTTTRSGQNSVATIEPHKFRNKLSMIQGDRYSYTISGLGFSRGSHYLAQFSTLSKGASSPLINFVNLPNYCHVILNGKTLENYGSRSQLSSQKHGSIREGINLVVKLASWSNSPKRAEDTFRGEGIYQIVC